MFRKAITEIYTMKSIKFGVSLLLAVICAASCLLSGCDFTG